MRFINMIKTLQRLILVLLVITVLCADGRKTSRGRSSSSSRGGSSRRTNNSAQPAPTSFSVPQASAPKPSLFGWQEKPAQKTQTSSRRSKPTNTHSYPSSNTGLSGNQPKQPSVQQESIQRNSAPQQSAPRPGIQSQPNQASHSYPASNSLSGNSGAGAGYPQSTGLSGSNGAPHTSNSLSGNSGTGSGYPQGTGLSGPNAAPPPYQAGNYPKTGANYPTNNMGNNYNHPQGQPPPYSNTGSNYHPQGQPPPYSNTGSNYHPQGGAPPYTSVGNSYNHPPPPPPYSNFGPGYGNYGGHGSYNPGYGQQMPGYFGNYAGGGKGFGGISNSNRALAGVGIAGAGVGTILTGLALWNLARSTGHHRHTVIYDNRGQPVAVAPENNSTANAMESLLGDLINCTLTINNGNSTEILAIPCAIATSFTPEADVKDINGNKNENDNTKCIITVVNKEQREFMTTIPCSVLLNTAAENNVTEPPLLPNSNSTELNINGTMIPNIHESLDPNAPTALRLSGEDGDQNTNLATPQANCTLKAGEIPDPINPCFPVTHNLTVIPLQSTESPIA